MHRRTRIVVTVGPAMEKPGVLKQIIAAGANIFRLNFSHGDHAEKERWIEMIREHGMRATEPLAILADLQGPKMRTGALRGKVMDLKAGERVSISTEQREGGAGVIATDYAGLTGDVQSGDRILLSDGLITLRAEAVTATMVSCLVETGGLLREHQGINLPGGAISAPALTEKDLCDLDFSIQKELDFIALSFVRRPEDIEDARRRMFKAGRVLPLIAKIERPEAVECFDAILDKVDGVMIARGDLGVEMGPERVPVIQKDLIRRCNEAGKPVITATQMLESMIVRAMPTRAETSDVANAILDGSDAVMLSGETSVGAHPVAAVEVLARVADDVERHGTVAKPWCAAGRGSAVPHVPEAIGRVACRLACDIGAAAIIAFSQTGKSATLIARHRPGLMVIGVTPSEAVRRRLLIHAGIVPLLVPLAANTDLQIKSVEEAVLAAGLLSRGDLVVLTMGAPVSMPGSTNLIKAHRLSTGAIFEVY